MFNTKPSGQILGSPNHKGHSLPGHQKLFRDRKEKYYSFILITQKAETRFTFIIASLRKLFSKTGPEIYSKIIIRKSCQFVEGWIFN